MFHQGKIGPKGGPGGAGPKGEPVSASLIIDYIFFNTCQIHEDHNVMFSTGDSWQRRQRWHTRIRWREGKLQLFSSARSGLKFEES